MATTAQTQQSEHNSDNEAPGAEAANAAAAQPAQQPLEWAWTQNQGWQQLPHEFVPGAGQYAWNRDRGWFQMPVVGATTAAEQTLPQVGATSGQQDQASQRPSISSWISVGSNQPPTNTMSGDWNNAWSAGAWQTGGWDGNRFERDDDPPQWDGKSSHRSTYFRKIDIWESVTRMNINRRGPKLLGGLTGDAFDKLENVTPQSLAVPNGVELFKEHIIRCYEPIEDYRIGHIMDQFIDEFSRKNGQEIQDYSLQWDREILKVEKVAGP